MVEELALIKFDRISVAGFGGNIVAADAFLVEIAIHQFALVMVQALANHEEPYVLLGRDVLNLHKILLDGPKLLLEIDSQSEGIA